MHMVAVEPEIRAEYNAPLSKVCQDSCMEFFFSPSLEDDRYVNIEINPNCATNIGVGSCRTDRVRVIPKNEDPLFQKRTNRYMVEHVDYLIAYAWHPASNARELLQYARVLERKGTLSITLLTKS